MKKLTEAKQVELRQKLRIKAEERLGNISAEDAIPGNSPEMVRLLHELQIHIIELEVQNEALWQLREESDAQMKRYSELYHDLYDNAPVGYCTVSRDDGTILKVNHTAARLLGVPDEELMGVRFGLLVSVESRPIVNALLEQIFEQNEKETASAMLLRSWREPFWTYIEARANKNGRSCRIMLMDITEQKQKEELLQTLSTVASKTTNTVIITNPSGYTTWVNESFSHLTEYSFAEALGKKPGALLQGAETDWTTILTMRNAISQARGFDVELVNYTKSKIPYWIHIKCDPLFDTNGVLTGFIAIQANITERKKVEARLRFKAELLNNVGEAIIATDVQGKITYWNTVAQTLYGWSAEEAIGNMITDIIPSNHKRGKAQEIFSNLTLTRGERWSGRFAVQHKDGTEFEVMVTDIPLLDENSVIVGVFSISRIISEHDKAEEKLRIMEASLNAIFDASVQLLYLIAPDYQVLAFNNAAAIGIRRAFQKEIVLGDDIRNYMIPEDKEQFEKNFHQALQGETVQIERSATVPTAGTLWFEFRYVPVIDAEGFISGISFTALDITQRLQIEQSVRQYKEQSSELLLPSAPNAEYITIATATQGNVMLNMRNDIAYLEGAKDYTRFVTHTGKQYLTFGALGKWEERFLPQGFIRIHRSTIVNIDAIRSWEYKDKIIVITLLNGTNINVSRGYKAHFLSIVK
jgi:PAS domain S-box-containing protein